MSMSAPRAQRAAPSKPREGFDPGSPAPRAAGGGEPGSKPFPDEPTTRGA